jgi:hypothetical protein
VVRLKDELAEFFAVPFNRLLVAGLLILGILILFYPAGSEAPEGNYSLTLHFFYSPACPHCAEQEEFNKKLEDVFPEVLIVRHDVTIPEESRLLLIMAQNFSAGPSGLGVPTTIFGNHIFTGYESDETTGAAIREAVEKCLSGECGVANGEGATKSEIMKNIDIPLLGKTDLSGLPLPALAVVLGLIDGFNPCAMWVLVYLISIVMRVNDRRRLWIIVGSFVLASGILYFLFMSAWLNAFLLLGYIRPVTVAVGLIALGGGILAIKEYLDTDGAMVCRISGEAGKKKLGERMREIVSSPLTIATIAAIIALAFTVNSIEFVCSSAIPAVFTQILALSRLSPLEYYGYIALYDFFFMLDDLLVFGSAAMIYGSSGQKYARACRIIGGAIMLILGFLLLFAPRLLS